MDIFKLFSNPSVQGLMDSLSLFSRNLSAASPSIRPYAENFVLPGPLTNGSAGFSDTASSNGLGSVQIQRPNTTSYEGWYFDAVSTDLTKAVIFGPFVFYNEPNPLTLRLSLSYEDGTFNQFVIPGNKLFVSTIGAGSSAVSSDGSYSWHGASDLAEYIINMDLPELGISGQINLQSAAPAHVPCGPAVEGAPFGISWDLNWVNPIPDGQATVDLKINGTSYTFQGPGYHDKNFGPFSFIPDLNQWYWGHGRAGDLSVVWFEHINKANHSSANAYISKDNKIIHSACSGVTVRPFGPGVEFPLPFGTEATVEGFDVFIDAGLVGAYRFRATASKKVDEGPGLGRWAGTLKGGLVGEEALSGPALWDMIGPIPDLVS